MAYRPTRVSNLTAYRVNGTPADCVALGTHHWDSVDLVLSGLNLGFNLRQCDLALGHAGGGEAGRAVRYPRRRVERARGRRSGLRAREAVDPACAGDRHC